MDIIIIIIILYFNILSYLYRMSWDSTVSIVNGWMTGCVSHIGNELM
jgi:hypothetical protein